MNFIFGLAIFVTLAVGSLAIDCYLCEGPDGESGGCGQDPFHGGHGVGTPNVNISSYNNICYVSCSFKLFLFQNGFFQSFFVEGRAVRRGANELSLEECEQALVGVTLANGTVACCDTDLCNLADALQPTTTALTASAIFYVVFSELFRT